MQKSTHVLALSGGGFRGLYTAVVLAALEKRAGKPLAQCFDLICGTSIGGIMALALSLEIPAERIVNQMKASGADIFPPRRRAWPMCWRKWLRSKYSSVGLKAMLEELFGDSTINDSTTKIVVPSVNYSTGRPQFFKTPHDKPLCSDYKLKMADVALATSAAPMFFPIHKIAGTPSCYVDGGLFGNAPGLFGVYEAERYLKQELENIHLLAIGTMGGEFRINADDRLDKGLCGWGEDLFSLTISTQEKVTHFMLEKMLGDRYSYIDELPTKDQVKHVGLDVATAAAVDTLSSMGAHSAQKFVGSDEAKKFLSHDAPKFVSPFTS